MRVVTAKGGSHLSKRKRYEAAYNEAVAMLMAYDGLEIRSALKEAGSAHGIDWGVEMGKFVHWAEDKLGVSHIRA